MREWDASSRMRRTKVVKIAELVMLFPLYLPMSRIIGSDHTLIGYGGGLEAKRKLLAIEGVLLW